MLSENIKSKLEAYDKEPIYKKDDWGKETIIDTIEKRKLRQLGCICRMNDNRLIKHTIFAKIDGQPRKSRPSGEWLNDIKD